MTTVLSGIVRGLHLNYLISHGNPHKVLRLSKEKHRITLHTKQTPQNQTSETTTHTTKHTSPK